MNRKQLMDPNAGSTLMRREAGMAHSLQGETEEPVPNVVGSIWRRRWAVLTITVLSVIGAVVFLRVMPPSYTATAQLTIDPPQQMPQLTGIGGPVESGDGYLWTQIAIMESPAVCGDAAKTLRPNATEDELHDFTNQLRGLLSADVGKKDGVITLGYTDKSAVDAANNVNAIVQSYIKYVTKTHGDTSHALLEVLHSEKAKYDDLLHKQRDAEIDFRTQNPQLGFTTAGGGNVVNTALDRLFSDKTAKILELSQVTASFNTADQLRNDLPKLQQFAISMGFTTPSTSNEIAQTQQILNQAEMQLLMSKGSVGSQNPNFLRAQNIVTEMTAKLQILGKKYADEFLGSLEQAKLLGEEKVKAIDEQIKLTEKDATGVNFLQGELMKLQNAEAGTMKIVDALEAQIKAQELSTTFMQIPNVRILQAASGVDASRSPEPSRILLLTLAVGLGCGVGFALLRDKLDQRVRSAEDIASLLGLPVVGVVPHMKRGLTPLARAQAVHWDPMSEVSEAYRAVRTAVHFGVPAGQARTIVVTSPTPGDGKSTLASNLAISMAQAGKRTLLLDADFRRPVQHRMFEMKDESGLTAVLAGHEPLAKAIRRTVVEGLDLLPAGPLPLNPSELLNGESFASILEELTQKYDHVVLDCPPVIAVTDARILGAICDLSLLVLRAGKTTRQGAELARGGLMSVGSRLLGVVVNDVPRGEEHYGYYGSYAYQGSLGRRSLPDDNGGASNGHSNRSRRRLPSPAGIDSRQ